MRIKILDIKEVGSSLKIKTETEFGIDNIELNISKRKMDFSGVPKWQVEIKRLLDIKYKDYSPIKKEEIKSYIGKEI